MSDIRSVTFEDAVGVVQSDTADDPNGPFAGFYVGVAGDVRAVTVRGRIALLKGCKVGRKISLAIRRVLVTGTTAQQILGLVAPPYRTGN
jgi:hypothetical protein